MTPCALNAYRCPTRRSGAATHTQHAHAIVDGRTAFHHAPLYYADDIPVRTVAILRAAFLPLFTSITKTGQWTYVVFRHFIGHCKTHMHLLYTCHGTAHPP